MTPFVAEPVTRYASRPAVVTDASLIAAIVYAEPARDEALRSLAGAQPVAPELLRFEIANAGMNKIRRKECDLETVLEALGRFEQIMIETLPPPLAPVLRLAAHYGLSAYDASYLWLVGELKAPLLTFDKQLAAAARDHFAQLSPR